MIYVNNNTTNTYPPLETPQPIPTQLWKQNLNQSLPTSANNNSTNP